MFRHYITIALRNLAKYKVQNIISIVSLAVGITTLAVVQCFLHIVRQPAVFSQPYADRCYYMRLVDENNTETNAGIPLITNVVDNLMRSEGEMSCVEMMCPVNGVTEGAWVSFTMDDGTVRRKSLDIMATANEYPHYRGIRSAITGKPVPVLKKDEVLLSEAMAKKVFGDINHIGATLSFSYWNYEYEFVLADVFEDVLSEVISCNLLFSIWDDGEFGSDNTDNLYITRYEVLLREGFTADDLKKEADIRLKPCGKTVQVIPLKDAPSDSIMLSGITRSIIWLVGAMVLLSSLISFIRMQIQLLRMRRRELSLRIVNGASSGKLFIMLFTENAIIVLASALLALLLSLWLRAFADGRLMSLLSEMSWKWEGIGLYIFEISAGILIINVIAMLLSLRKTLNGTHSLSEHMHGSDGLFRKAMLVLQTVICTVFICGTLSLLQFVRGMSEHNNIPDNDRFYRQCVYLRAYNVNDKVSFRKELEQCRYAQTVIPYSEEFDWNQDEMNDTIKQVLKDESLGSIRNYVMPNTAFFDFYRMDINWFVNPEPDENYLLVSEYFYNLLQESGYPVNNMMTTYDGRLLPVYGTYPSIPYSSMRSQRISIAVITPESDLTFDQYILVPEKGKYQALFSEACYLYDRFNPELVDTEVYNLRDNQGAEVTILDAMRGGSFILSGICLIICAMSIYSTLLLNIRARRKEVAVRKVNGAKRRDVALLFGKLYIVLASICIIISVPIGLLFNSLVIRMGDGFIAPQSLSPLLPIAGGCLFTLLLIAVTVWGNISRIMKLNPAEYLVTQ